SASSSNQVNRLECPSWRGEQVPRKHLKRQLGESTRPNIRVNGTSQKKESVVLTSLPDRMGMSCASSGKLSVTKPTESSSLIPSSDHNAALSTALPRASSTTSPSRRAIRGN